ncbi:MAG: DUF3656 domain-containing protein [Oscillospiraceae bacterium]
MSRPELLAPAGSREALIAAVQAGADAVYLGYGDFNARRNAKNFSAEEFREAVDYCHLRGVKVYLTLNTLLTDRELPGAAETARHAARCGVDAILVQDFGVLELLRQVTPETPLHASTQMSLFTLGGVEEAARLGMTRAVLARELSREDTRYITERAPIEIESFVHGALCMCYSGQCAMSAVIGGRSGNRGLCAQPCRLPYGVDGKANGHPLSLKDSCLAREVPELAEMGVACLKLEGRMKRPEYVALVTDVYARLIRENRPATAEELALLEEVFSRSGFTQDYWEGKKGPQMFGVRPESAPEPKALYARARAIYEKEDRRLVGVRLVCRLRPGVPASLTAEDGDGNLAAVSGDVPEAARSRALTAEEVAQRLSKTGGTAFRAEEVTVELAPGLMLSAAALNALRREALDRLAALRTEVTPRIERDFIPAPKEPGESGPPRFTCSIKRPEQLTEQLVACGPARVDIPLELIGEMDLAPYLGRTELCAVLPRVWRDKDEPKLRRQLLAAKAAGVTAAAVGNLGQLPLVQDLRLALRGDFGLNLFNSQALLFARHLGLSSATVSFELRREQIRDLSKPLPTEAVVYGRLPLMLTENCLIHNSLGCRCETPHVLRDRTGAAFPILPAFGCRSELQNAKVLFLADRGDYRDLGLTFARLRFTTEPPEECVRVFRRYLGENDYVPADYTRGLYARGVE